MKTLFSITLILGLSAAIGFAQPTIGGITNAASFTLAPFPGASIAQGSFFSIFGTGLGPSVADCGPGLTDCLWKPYPVPTSIQGVSAAVTVGNNAPVNVYLYLVFESQINAVMPSSVTPGSGQITVTFNGQTSQPANITVSPGSFGTFTLNQSGTGPGIFFNIDPVSHGGSLNTFFNTARPGQYITMYGTGFGAPADVADEGTQAPTFPDDSTQAPHNLSVQVWVGGQPATVAYAGRSQYTALDQVNFIVPAGPGVQGCFVEVAIVVTPPGGNLAVSNFTSMAVDPNGEACHDADGINMSGLATAVNKGSVNIGIIGLRSTFLNVDILGPPFVGWLSDTVGATFGTLSGSALESFQGVGGSVPSVNNCSVTPYQYFPPPADPALASLTYLDAGSALQIQGPLGTVSIPKNSNGNGYSAVVGGQPLSEVGSVPPSGPPPFFVTTTANADGSYALTNIVAGTYTVSSLGGAVGAFTATVAVSSGAAAFQWTNESIPDNGTGSSPIPLNQPLTVTWTGGDPQGFINITLMGSNPKLFYPDPATTGIVAQCVANASAGSFTVPTYVLQALPSPITINNGSPIAAAMLVGPFSAPVQVSPTPSGLDAAYIYYSFLQGVTTTWQ